MYDYDAKSRRDELIDIIVKTLKITTRALRPDVSILVGAFPESEWNCTLPHRVTRLSRLSSFEASILVSRHVFQARNGDCQGILEAIRCKAVQARPTEIGKGQFRDLKA